MRACMQVYEEVWQDAQGQPEDFSQKVADTQYDAATDENDQEDDCHEDPGVPLQPEGVPGVECKADIEDESKKSKGTFQDDKFIYPTCSRLHAYLNN